MTPAQCAAMAADTATREDGLAQAGLLDLRNLLRRAAWGHAPRRDEQAPLFRFEGFEDAYVVRQEADGRRGGASADFFKLSEAYPAFSVLDTAAWSQITLSLSAQDWICLAGHWAALMRARDESPARHLFLRVLAGVGTAMRRQPGDQEAMAAVLSAFRRVLSDQRESAVLLNLERWLLIHGPDRLRRPSEPPQSALLAERVRWSDCAASWHRTHMVPTVSLSLTVTAAWLTAGPRELVDVAGWMAVESRREREPVVAKPRGLFAECLHKLSAPGRRAALCDRSDLTPAEIAHLSRRRPRSVAEDLRPQHTPWGVTAADLLTRLGDTLQQEQQVDLLQEMLRDPATHPQALELLPERVLMLLTSAQQVREEQAAFLLLERLLLTPASWAAIGSAGRRGVLAHPSARIRLLGIRALGETHLADYASAVPALRDESLRR